jgi:hypothetical protein
MILVALGANRIAQQQIRGGRSLRCEGSSIVWVARTAPAFDHHCAYRTKQRSANDCQRNVIQSNLLQQAGDSHRNE